MTIRWIAALVMAMGLTVFVGTAKAVDLQAASNQQILDELSFRLRNGGGGGGGRTTTANYLCDSSTYLKMSIVGPTGTETTKQVYIGDSAACTSQVSILNANRSRIDRTVVVAVCDSSTYLNRISVTVDGAVHDLNNTYIGDANQCLSQARTINTSN